MLRRLFRPFGLISMSEYDVVYRWYEEKRNECQAWEVRVNVLESERDNLQMRLDARDAIALEEMEQLRADNADLEDRLKMRDVVIDKLATEQIGELNAVRNERDAAREALREAQALGQQYQKEVEATWEKNNELSHVAQAIQQQLGLALEEVERKTDEIRMLGDKLALANAMQVETGTIMSEPANPARKKTRPAPNYPVIPFGPDYPEASHEKY